MIKSLKDKIYSKAGIESQRTKNITKHVLLSFLYKGGSIIANFLLVPLTINYLNVENYGVWLTLSSFIAWFTFFDIGLGNGLRNKFAEAKAKGDLLLAQAYVSSAYYTIGTLSLILIVLFYVINNLIDWTFVFNTSSELNEDLKLLMPIVFGFFCLQLVTKLITTIYTADQHHSMQGKVNFITQVGSLILIWLLTLSEKSSLLFFGLVYSALPVIVLLVLHLIAFTGSYKVFKPKLIYWKKKYTRDIFELGIVFFVIQISGIVLFATDNLIIAHLFTPAEVVPYNIAYKYFSLTSMAYNIVAAPIWSSMTEAYHKNDFDWIKKTMNNFNKITCAFLFLIFIMLLVCDKFYFVWIGESTKIDFKLSLLMAVFFAFTLFAIPYTFFLNGTGKIRLQATQGVLVAMLNIPVSVLLSKSFNLGVSGVILGTLLCLIPTIILAPIQYYKIITNSAKGVWDK